MSIIIYLSKMNNNIVSTQPKVFTDIDSFLGYERMFGYTMVDKLSNSITDIFNKYFDIVSKYNCDYDINIKNKKKIDIKDTNAIKSISDTINNNRLKYVKILEPFLSFVRNNNPFDDVSEKKLLAYYTSIEIPDCGFRVNGILYKTKVKFRLFIYQKYLNTFIGYLAFWSDIVERIRTNKRVYTSEEIKRKQDHEKNDDRIKQKKEWVADNKEIVSNISKTYNTTINGRFMRAKLYVESFGIKFMLSEKDYINICVQQNCYLCDEKGDLYMVRLDKNANYADETNVVGMCKECHTIGKQLFTKQLNSILNVIKFARHINSNFENDGKYSYPHLFINLPNKPGFHRYFVSFCNRNRLDKREITKSEFDDLIKGDCYYCGKKPIIDGSYNGIDRIKYDQKYIKGNVVSCCTTCNMAKSDIPLELFFEKCKMITAKYLSADLDNIANQNIKF